jgi:tetratricopeptide (TPR) repeat protein
MQAQGRVQFFDVEEFEIISDYFYEVGKISEALEVLEMASEQHPYASHVLFKKVQVLTLANKTDEAQEVLGKLENMAPESYDLFMARANLYSRLGHHHKAIQQYRKAARNSDSPEEVFHLIGLEHQISGNYQQAVKFFKQSLEIFPDDELVIYNLGLCYDLMDEVTEGIRYFESLTDLSPYSESIWYHLGMLYAKDDQAEKAIWALDYAILIDEFFAAAYFEKARILEKTYRYQEAINTYFATFEFDPASGFAYYKIALCYLQQHHPKKAEIYLTKALQEDEELEDAYYELALLKDEQEEWSEAVHNIRKALALEPTFWQYRITSAEIYKRAGLLDEAIEVYRELIKESEAEARIYIDYAELLFDMCDFDGGMDVLYEGVNRFKDNSLINYRLAGYLFAIKEEDEGLIYFKKAYQIDPEARLFFFDIFPQLKDNYRLRSFLAATEG